MKKISLFFIIAACICGCREPKNTIHLRGQLKDMGSQEVVMHYNGAASMVGDSRDIVLLTDAEGRFDTVLPLTRPEYYSISRNTLYLTPGDDLEVFITTSNQEATFTGTGAEANNYMKGRLFPKGGSFLKTGKNARDNFENTKQVIAELATARKQELEAVKNVSDEFRSLENARITADVINSYISYAWYAKEYKGLSPEEMEEAQAKHIRAITPDLNKMLKELTDEKLLDVAVVRDVLGYYGEKGEDWFQGITLPQRTQELYAAYEQAEILRKEVTPVVAEQINVFIRGMKNPDFATELELKLKQASRLLAGQPAIDFSMIDTNGNEKHLSDFKGKMIYLDLWATWCGPCIQESPAFEALSEKYKDKDIVFIPVSTDTQQKAWKEYLSAHHKSLAQYNSTDQALKEGWCVMYIPRFILIDKNFNIIDAYAPRPSEEKTVALLDSLLMN